MIMSAILMSTLFYKACIIQEEIWCWLLYKRLKGLIENKKYVEQLSKQFIGSIILEACMIY